LGRQGGARPDDGEVLDEGDTGTAALDDESEWEEEEEGELDDDATELEDTEVPAKEGADEEEEDKAPTVGDSTPVDEEGLKGGCCRFRMNLGFQTPAAGLPDAAPGLTGVFAAARGSGGHASGAALGVDAESGDGILSGAEHVVDDVEVILCAGLGVSVSEPTPSPMSTCLRRKRGLQAPADRAKGFTSTGLSTGALGRSSGSGDCALSLFGAAALSRTGSLGTSTTRGKSLRSVDDVRVALLFRTADRMDITLGRVRSSPVSCCTQ